MPLVSNSRDDSETSEHLGHAVRPRCPSFSARRPKSGAHTRDWTSRARRAAGRVQCARWSGWRTPGQRATETWPRNTFGALALHTARNTASAWRSPAKAEQPAPRQDVTVARQVLAPGRADRVDPGAAGVGWWRASPGRSRPGLSMASRPRQPGARRGPAPVSGTLLPWLWSFEGEPSPLSARRRSWRRCASNPAATPARRSTAPPTPPGTTCPFSQGQALPTRAPGREAVERTHVAAPPTSASAPELTAEVAGPTLQVIDVPVAAGPRGR